ncbi:MAG: hypothetical protein LBH77_00175 [Tannerella sp.]|nr:hypothetical protein [Tannerella sp.]
MLAVRTTSMPGGRACRLMTASPEGFWVNLQRVSRLGVFECYLEGGVCLDVGEGVGCAAGLGCASVQEPFVDLFAVVWGCGESLAAALGYGYFSHATS